MRAQAFRLSTLLLSAALLAGLGCSQPHTTQRRSGLMDYLYADKQEAPTPHPEGAKLHLPLKLGIAFVPSGAAWHSGSGLAPGNERSLLDIVKRSFAGKPWVKEIKIIPSTYLMARGGFDNLTQMARFYGVSVMALVSVDQIQYTNPKWYSFTYLSILGAYVLPGDANDTRTLIDAAVFDVPSRTFLLRAPGQSMVKGSSTLVNRDQKLREDSAQGMELAMKDLAANLEAEVASFKADVVSGERSDVDIIDAQGQSLHTGGGHVGGAFGWVEALAGLALAVAAGRRRRRS